MTLGCTEQVRNTLISEGLWPIDLAASGRIQTPEDIARMVFMGANRINMGTSLMLANGCVKVREYVIAEPFATTTCMLLCL